MKEKRRERAVKRARDEKITKSEERSEKRDERRRGRKKRDERREKIRSISEKGKGKRSEKQGMIAE